MSFEATFTLPLLANLPLIVIVFAIIIQRLLELRLAKKNYQIARERGAIEYGARHYPLFVILHSLWLISLFAESWRMCDADAFWLYPHQLALAFVCFFAFVCAEFLRYWAIFSLKESWNTRIIVVPGAKAVREGAYRFFKHPNYVAVAIELAAVPLIFGAWKTALWASLANAALLLFIRIPAENKAVREHLL